MSEIVKVLAGAYDQAFDIMGSDEEAARFMIAELDAAGFQVVPKEPTEEMILAGVPRLLDSGRGSNALCHAYRAMLRASQSDTGREG